MGEGLGVEDIIFNNKGIDTISQIASYKTITNILSRNNFAICEDLSHTPVYPYISQIYDKIIYDTKLRYKQNSFKPVIKYTKISKGAGLSNYLIIIQNIPALFDYATLNKKSKDFYCMIVYTGLHQPTKKISNESIKFISQTLKRKSFKIHSIDLSSDFIAKKTINSKYKDEVKESLKRRTDDKSFLIVGNSLYCNSIKSQTVKKLIIYDKYIKQKIYQKQVLKENLCGWKRLEIELQPQQHIKKMNFASYIKSNEFKRALSIYDLIKDKLNINDISNDFLNYQISSFLDNRIINNKKSKKQYNSKESLTRFKMSDFKPYTV